MTIRELKADIERQQRIVMDEEWLLEQTLAAHEDPGRDSTEGYEERMRLDALADAQVGRLLDTIPFGSLATRRLDYLLSVAKLCVSVWYQRRLLSQWEYELATLEEK